MNDNCSRLKKNLQVAFTVTPKLEIEDPLLIKGTSRQRKRSTKPYLIPRVWEREGQEAFHIKRTMAVVVPFRGKKGGLGVSLRVFILNGFIAGAFTVPFRYWAEKKMIEKAEFSHPDRHSGRNPSSWSIFVNKVAVIVNLSPVLHFHRQLIDASLSLFTFKWRGKSL